jgi:hypothetical protein
VDFSTKEDIQRLVDERVRETANLEFKRALPLPDKNIDIAKDLAAMVNVGGGTIIVGISERFSRANKLHPFELAGKAERIAAIARKLIDEPLVLGDIADVVMNDAGEGVIVVHVEPSDRVPHFVDGQAWGRSGPSNVTLSRAEIGRLFASTGRAFVEEFGVATRRPAAPRVMIDTDRRQTGMDSKGRISYSAYHRLVLENQGEEDAHDVEVVFLNEEGDPDPEGTTAAVLDIAEGPVKHLLAGQKVTYNFFPQRAPSPEVRLTWKDDSGTVKTLDQTVSL